MPHITPRLSVEGPDGTGDYTLLFYSERRVTGRRGLTRAEADALIAALQPNGAVIADELRTLRRKLGIIESVTIPHARAQSHANGFQAGWHAALTRVSNGSSVEELAALVPTPSDTSKE